MAGQLVRHTCDNKACVNPEHLLLGTHKDNSDDKYSRGLARHAKGEERPDAKLTEALVREIRASTEIDRVLAERYGVSLGAVNHARVGRTWKHVK